MTDDKSEKYVSLIRVFLFLGGICFLAGFFIATISTDTVFYGIAVMIVGGFFSAIIALIPTVKLIQHQKEEKESRIRRIEEEIELLKKKL